MQDIGFVIEDIFIRRCRRKREAIETPYIKEFSKASF